MCWVLLHSFKVCFWFQTHSNYKIQNIVDNFEVENKKKSTEVAQEEFKGHLKKMKMKMIQKSKGKTKSFCNKQNLHSVFRQKLFHSQLSVDYVYTVLATSIG